MEKRSFLYRSGAYTANDAGSARYRCESAPANLARELTSENHNERPSLSHLRIWY